jgi:2-polyprenyl-3-methyl-5-hydroxy-6-metoxy-1,4-benzoquinol methylase
MPDWQERITRETPPQIRLEHVVRYAAAVPLIAGGSWCDLGSGSGLAAEEAGAAPKRALFVDVDNAAAVDAAARFPDAEANDIALDLSRDDGVQALRDLLADWDGLCITCFELIEHLDDFRPLLRFLAERAGAGTTVVLSVPNDSLTGVENPFHTATWGEGSLAELRTLLPEHRAFQQVAIVGSALRGSDDAPDDVSVDIRLEPVAGPSHMLVAFGPRAGEVAAPRRAKAVDADEHLLWERQREADLAFFKARLALLEKQ